MKYILPPCGQSTDYPHFLFPFPLAHSPKRQPCVAWLTDFREKSRWKLAQAYRKVNLPYPCLSRPHGVFPKRRKGTSTFPLFPYL